MFSPQNKIIIIAAPSGAGKTSITKHLLKTFPDRLSFSISCATRQPRNYELDGKDYYFITPEEFRKKIINNEFAEWQMVYEGKYYGTLKSELNRIWDENKVPLLDVDVKGGLNVQQQYRNSTLSLFIQPPSIEELRNRLEKRGTETPESLEARINKATYELTYRERFGIPIVNDSLEIASNKAENAVREFLDKDLSENK
jgi:guanylate kinase